jgi:DNA-damage-inducible protein D
MDIEINQTIKNLETNKQLTTRGGEYWMARTLQTILGYTTWENFEWVIEKAKIACETSGIDPDDHFLETTKMVEIGSGAKREQVDLFLDRYACYLIAMSGDSKKIEIGTAQTYFAVQTRLQELQQQRQSALDSDETRLKLREEVKAHILDLNSTAKQAGVQRYGLFHDAGYRGLYEMGLAQIKLKKGLKTNEQLFDRAGSAELAANYFRITQAEEKLKRDKVNNERQAIDTHLEVAREVRRTIKKIGGVMPENLPAEPSIKKIASQKKKTLPKPE